MEWTDGMEYQLTQIAKLTAWPCKVESAVSPLLTSARGRGYVLAVWMSGDVCVNWNEPKVCRA